MSAIMQSLEQLRQDAEAGLAQTQTSEATKDWYTEFLGRKGRLTALLRGLGSLPAEERAQMGKAANEVKVALEAALEERQAAIARAEMEAAQRAAAVDVTLPGRRPTVGGLHPITRTLREIYAIFGSMGFQVYDSPEVETDDLNFQLLNIPPGHPARDMWDTFYSTTPDVILRTHTCPGQIRVMREFAPEPIRVILPGNVYRYEQVTARSESMFYQVEGLAVGKKITFTDLKGVFVDFAQQMYRAGPTTALPQELLPLHGAEHGGGCRLRHLQGRGLPDLQVYRLAGDFGLAAWCIPSCCKMVAMTRQSIPASPSAWGLIALRCSSRASATSATSIQMMCVSWNALADWRV